MFPYYDWFPPNLQMNLDRAFIGLHYGLDLVEREKGLSQRLEKCRGLTQEAYDQYKAGKPLDGQQKLVEMHKLLMRWHSE